MNIAVNPLAGALGAELTGVNFSQFNDDDYAAVRMIRTSTLEADA